jgi:hypothetical protein
MSAMKLTPEDPLLTAYLLGELSPEESAAIEAAAAADPAIRRSLQDLEHVGHHLTEELFGTKPVLKPSQRQKILEAARHPETAKVVHISDHRPNDWKPWLIRFAAAAALVIAILLFTKVPKEHAAPVADQNEFYPSPAPAGSPTAPTAAAPPQEEWRTVPIDVAVLPAPGPADASRALPRNLSGGPTPTAAVSGKFSKAIASRNEALAKTGDQFFTETRERLKNSPMPAASDLPPLVHRGSVIAAISPQLALPVAAGSASLDWITRSIRSQHQLPPQNAVRIEEILNHFALRPAGATAISQGVTVSTETMPCPWKPSATLLIIAFRGAADAAREIQATFQADPETVNRYRLLGFSPVAGAPDANLPTHLPAKALTLVAIEIEPKNAATTFGSVQWTVNGQPAAEIPLARRLDAEPSDDARFASLLCTYGQWLAGDQANIIDGEIVAALAREMVSDTLSPDRHDLIELINQSLKL